MGKNSKRQELFSTESIRVLQFSLASLQKAAVHPYCLAKLKTCLKPVAACAIIVYFVGIILMIPLAMLGTMVSILTAGWIDRGMVADAARNGLTSAVSLVPFVALVILRSVVRKPLFKCFIHMLREINPQLATSIEIEPAASRTSKTKSKKASRYFNKVAFLLALEVVLHFARKSPWLGRPAVAIVRFLPNPDLHCKEGIPVIMLDFMQHSKSQTHFYTMKRVLGRDRAVGLSLFALVPRIEPWLLKFVQLWRTSNVLGQELVSDYVSKYVPQNERLRFYKNHDVDIAVFALPGSILLQIPVVGPLAFFPIQASAAFLVDKLARQDSVVGSAGSGGTIPPVGRQIQKNAPTLPKGQAPPNEFPQIPQTLPEHPNPVYGRSQMQR